MTEARWGPVCVRRTPWDGDVFGVSTAEYRVEGAPSAAEVEAGLIGAVKSGQYDLLYGRLLPTTEVSRALLLTGFYACETQLVYSLSERSRRLSALDATSGCTVSLATADDADAVLAAAHGLFRFSRFHEDPLIPVDLAEARMRAWVRDLAVRQVTLLVARSSKGQLIGFMFCTIGRVAELTLGGCTPEASFLAPKFWKALVDFLFSLGARSITAAVSAANVPMMRVYGDLGFNVLRTAFDYHWHRPGSPLVAIERPRI